MLLTTIEVEGDALRLHRLPQAPLEQSSAAAPEPPVAAELPSSAAPDRPYSPWRSLAPRSWLPLIELAEGAIRLGVSTFGQDALGRERLHQVDRPTSPVQDERVLGLVAGIDTRREHWLSEGPSRGFQLRLFAETSHGLHAAFSGDVYRADLRLHFPLGKTVLSLRWNEAWGEPDAEPFQLGGSDSDPAYLLPILNQRDFALRGYSSGEPALTGDRARVGTLELRVPLRDVDRHAMVPPLGLNRVALNVFLDVGAAWARGAGPDYHRGIGAELMAELRAGYLFGIELRLGVAEGLDDPGKTMAYLRIGRSF